MLYIQYVYNLKHMVKECCYNISIWLLIARLLTLLKRHQALEDIDDLTYQTHVHYLFAYSRVWVSQQVNINLCPDLDYSEKRHFVPSSGIGIMKLTTN